MLKVPFAFAFCVHVCGERVGFARDVTCRSHRLDFVRNNRSTAWSKLQRRQWQSPAVACLVFIAILSERDSEKEPLISTSRLPAKKLLRSFPPAGDTTNFWCRWSHFFQSTSAHRIFVWHHGASTSMSGPRHSLLARLVAVVQRLTPTWSWSNFSLTKKKTTRLPIQSSFDR